MLFFFFWLISIFLLLLLFCSAFSYCYFSLIAFRNVLNECLCLSLCMYDKRNTHAIRENGIQCNIFGLPKRKKYITAYLDYYVHNIDPISCRQRWENFVNCISRQHTHTHKREGKGLWLCELSFTFHHNFKCSCWIFGSSVLFYRQNEKSVGMRKFG